MLENPTEDGDDMRGGEFPGFVLGFEVSGGEGAWEGVEGFAALGGDGWIFGFEEEGFDSFF